MDGRERNRRRFYGIINKAKSDVLRSPPSIVNHTTAPAGVGTLVEDMWPESINSNYLDPVSKKIVPPKNSIEAANRADAPMWKRAYEIERDILIKMGCFQCGFTLAELRKMGHTQKPLQQEIMYEAKYDPTGTFMEARCRIYVQEYQYQCRPDPEFPQSVMLGPTNMPKQLLQTFGNRIMYRNGFNISKTDSQILPPGAAAPFGNWRMALKPEETIIMKYPRGWIAPSANKQRKYMYMLMNMDIPERTNPSAVM